MWSFACAAPVLVAVKQLVARGAHDEDWSCEVLEQVAQERESVVVRLVQVLEHEHERAA